MIYPFFVALLLALAVTGSYRFLKETFALEPKLFPDMAMLKENFPVLKEKVQTQAGANRLDFDFVGHAPPHWTPLNNISRRAIAAVLMSEDGGFFSHHGYEPELIRKAWEENRRAGRVKRGASTITQQVIKNLFLTSEKTMIRKLRELLLAVEIERTLSKKKILEIYFNIVEWGPNLFGIQQAAAHYFKKSPQELNAKDGALLAYLLPNPLKYHHVVKMGNLSPYAQSRVTDILKKLWKAGQVSEEEFEDYASEWAETSIPSDL